MSQSLPGASPPVPAPAAVIGVGAGAGVLSGLLGVGGGIVLVPALASIFKFPQRRAQATSLVAIIFTAVAGAITYSFTGHFALGPAALIAAGGVAGSLGGAEIAARTPDQVIRVFFAVVMLAAAVRMFFPQPEAAGKVAALGPGTVAGLLATGLAMGIVSALVGVGGGVILVPILILAFHYPAHLSQGTSLLVMIPIAAAGAWRNSRHGHTDYRTGALAGLGGVAGSPLGALAANALPTLWLQRVFAVLLLFCAGQMIYLSVRERLAARAR